MKFASLLLVLASLFSAEAAFADGPAICWGHPLPKSRHLCQQAFDAGRAAGAGDEEITIAVKECGFMNWPERIQSCLLRVIQAYSR